MISAGWRSGSTAVQRLLVSSGDAMIWGEPLTTSEIYLRLRRLLVEGVEAPHNKQRSLAVENVNAALAEK